MEIGFDGITGRWGPSWKISRREYMEAIFCPGLFSISFFLLPVYNEGNESLCHMTELSSKFHHSCQGGSTWCCSCQRVTHVPISNTNKLRYTKLDLGATVSLLQYLCSIWIEQTFVYVLPKKSHETTCVSIILAFLNICLLCMCMRVCTHHKAYVGVQNNFQESVLSFHCVFLSSSSYESWQQVSLPDEPPYQSQGQYS